MTYSEREYWTERYTSGLTSGSGSEGNEANWKRIEICKIIKKRKPKSILDLGCGDGQLIFPVLKEFPDIDYRGIDIAEPIIHRHNQADFQRDGKTEFVSSGIAECAQESDLVLMIDVLPHLSTQDAHDRALSSFFESVGKVGVLTCWNSKIKGVKLARHCFHRKVKVPRGFRSTRITVPGVSVKDLVIVRPKAR